MDIGVHVSVIFLEQIPRIRIIVSYYSIIYNGHDLETSQMLNNHWML